MMRLDLACRSLVNAGLPLLMLEYVPYPVGPGLIEFFINLRRSRYELRKLLYVAARKSPRAGGW